MKKPLLLPLALLSGLAMMAQSTQNPNGSLVEKKIATKAYPMNMAIGGTENIFSGNAAKVVKKTTPTTQAASAPAGTLIGQTYYDLQSNASVARRVLNHGNGTLSVVFTVASDVGPNYSSRGTGYQFFNGTSWLKLGMGDTCRIEPQVGQSGAVRTGWPNIDVLKGNKEFIIAHNTAVYEFDQELNTAIGSPSPWTIALSGASLPMAPANHGNIWGRMSICGPGDSTIHVISNSSDSTIKRMGVKSPFLYARSLDGGKTWPIENSSLPGCDSTRSKTSGGDDYSIDAQNNSVAILHGGLGEDVTLWKSMDNGTTFTRILVDSVPYPRAMQNAPATDTMNTNDGSMSVVLDANNKAHVAYAAGRTLKATGGLNFFPGTIDLVYWNEINKTKVHVPINLADIDADGDGKYIVADSTTSITGAQYGNGSFLNKPSISLDTAGNIFIVFSLPADGDSTTDGTNLSYRDIWAVASTDNGATWTRVQNLTRTKGVEEAFASQSKLVTKWLHISFQSDGTPGTALTNKDPDAINDIRYLKVSTASILAGTAGIKEYTVSSAFDVSQNYPNPFSSLTNIDVTLQHSTDLMTLEITNLLGQVVYTTQARNLNTGNHTFTVDGSSYSAGIYFYTIRSNESSISKKMIVR